MFRGSLQIMKTASLPPLKQSAQYLGNEDDCLIFLHQKSGLPMADLKCRQMAGDVAWVERGTRKGADGVRSAGSLALMPHGGVVEVRPEDAHRGSERIWPHRRLPPADHLRVKPGGLSGIGP